MEPSSCNSAATSVLPLGPSMGSIVNVMDGVMDVDVDVDVVVVVAVTVLGGCNADMAAARFRANDIACVEMSLLASCVAADVLNGPA